MKILLACTVLTVAVLTGPLAAAEFQISNLRITKAWARATPGLSKTAAVYLTLRNTGGRNDQLVGAATPIAERATLHDSRTQDNIVHMFPIVLVEVRSSRPVVLRPGGMHIMLIGLKRILREGSAFPLTLRFAKAGSVEIRVSIAGIGAMGPARARGGDKENLRR